MKCMLCSSEVGGEFAPTRIGCNVRTNVSNGVAMSSVSEATFSEQDSRTPSSEEVALIHTPLGFEDEETSADIVDQDGDSDGDALCRIRGHAVDIYQVAHGPKPK